VEEIKLKEALKASQKLSIHHQKRERLVMYDDSYYYKTWVPGWEHSHVPRHAFKIGFYDECLTPAFRKMLVEAGVDRGYIMSRGLVVGSSKDNWDKLISETTYEQRLVFIKNIFEKAVALRCVPSDMAPSNVILYNGEISLIDLEAFQSFDWLFYGKPQYWEAQNRNLKKVPQPLWRDMSKNLLSYLEQCVGLKHDKKLDCVENIIKVNNKLKAL